MVGERWLSKYYEHTLTTWEMVDTHGKKRLAYNRITVALKYLIHKDQVNYKKWKQGEKNAGNIAHGRK